MKETNKPQNGGPSAANLHRRTFIAGTVLGLGGNLFGGPGLSSTDGPGPEASAKTGGRFPHFSTEPVSYLRVKMRDAFWAPRQRTTHDVSVNWITRHHDPAGGLEAFRKDPAAYRTQTQPSEMRHVKFIESMAAVVGVQPDPAIVGLMQAWAKPVMDGQAADGYLADGYPLGAPDRPGARWEAAWWSHEDYHIGNWIEAAIGTWESTGNGAMLRSAVKAADNMAEALLGSDRAYVSGHPEIEQALMRLYDATGNAQYLRLCGWLLGQRGRHGRRSTYGRYAQDHLPIAEQKSIEGHAVRAGFLFNGVTLYAGATGDPGYARAALAVWDDFADHKMYLHGGGGCKSAKNEGYLKDPDVIRPDDAYCESCAVFANFQWAHNLFRLTGEGRFIDVAERMLYNAFYASLSLRGDSCYYTNEMQTGVPAGAVGSNLADSPTLRLDRLATGCCAPNIVKLFNKVGGFFYSTDESGIYVKHYGASEAAIPFRGGVKLTQRTAYPWDGRIRIELDAAETEPFAVRLRKPSWAKSHQLSVNGEIVAAMPQAGWLTISRRWRTGDRIELILPMAVERLTMPPRFRGYENRAALQRGPVVYCLESQDLEGASPDTPLDTYYIPEKSAFAAEHRPQFLGGVTVLRGEVREILRWKSERPLAATFIPYGVWGNREASQMRIWLGARPTPYFDFITAQKGYAEISDS